MTEQKMRQGWLTTQQLQRECSIRGHVAPSVSFSLLSPGKVRPPCAGYGITALGCTSENRITICRWTTNYQSGALALSASGNSSVPNLFLSVVWMSATMRTGVGAGTNTCDRYCCQRNAGAATLGPPSSVTLNAGSAPPHLIERGASVRGHVAPRLSKRARTPAVAWHHPPTTARIVASRPHCLDVASRLPNRHHIGQPAERCRMGNAVEQVHCSLEVGPWHRRHVDAAVEIPPSTAQASFSNQPRMTQRLSIPATSIPQRLDTAAAGRTSREALIN